MNKKLLAIVGLAAVIAVSGGVLTMTGDTFIRGKDYTRETTAVSVEEQTVSDYPEQEESVAVLETESDFPTDNPTPQTEPAPDTGNDVNNYKDELISVFSYSVRRVVDHTTGEECTPREIFGKLYYYCRLSFYSDGKVELLLNPASDDLRTGTYRIYDDVVSVTYEDNSGAEYTILTDDYGDIADIVVNYGDFDVYFSR